MRKLIFATLLLTGIIAAAVSAQSTPAAIAAAYAPRGSHMVHKPLQASFWGFKNAILAFYETRYTEKNEFKSQRQYVRAYLLIPQGDGKYRPVLIDKLQDDNVDTVIESVFFANADKNPATKELIILYSATHNLQYLYEGTEYFVNIYNSISPRRPLPAQLSKTPSCCRPALPGGQKLTAKA